jgi:hypothetical protein
MVVRNGNGIEFIEVELRLVYSFFI